MKPKRSLLLLAVALTMTAAPMANASDLLPPEKVARQLAEILAGAQACSLAIDRDKVEIWIDTHAPGRSPHFADLMGAAIFDAAIAMPKLDEAARAEVCPEIEATARAEDLLAE